MYMYSDSATVRATRHGIHNQGTLLFSNVVLHVNTCCNIFLGAEMVVGKGKQLAVTPCKNLSIE